MSDGQIECVAYRALLDRYFDSTFAGRPGLDAHAATCADCRAAFAALAAALADLSCKAFVELVTEYLERTTSPANRARIDRHLELCEGCRSYLRQIRRTIELSGEAAVAPPEAHLRDTLTAAFRAMRGGR